MLESDHPRSIADKVWGVQEIFRCSCTVAWLWAARPGVDSKQLGVMQGARPPTGQIPHHLVIVENANVHEIAHHYSFQPL